MKKWFKSIYFVWTVISIILCLMYLVVNFGFEKPKSYGIEYFDKVEVQDNIETDSIDESTTIPIFEVNIRISDTDPTLNLYEMAITTYTDYEQQSYKRYVMQVVGEYQYYNLAGCKTWSDYSSFLAQGELDIAFSVIPNVITPNFYEIDSSGEWRSIDTQSEFDSCLDNLFVTANGESYHLEVGGSDAKYNYTQYYYENWFYEAIKNESKKTITREYTCIDLFHKFMSSFSSNTDIAGNRLFKNLDLDEFLTITKNNNGQFYYIKDFTDNLAYFNIKFTSKKSANLTSEDSMVNAILDDSNYSSSVKNEVTPYYSSSVDFTLHEGNFVPVYDETVSNYVLKLDSSFNSYLQSLNNLNLHIDIDLDNNSYTELVRGIDLTSLSGLQINSLVVVSNIEQDFYVLGSSKNIQNFYFSGALNLKNSSGGAWYE